MFTSANRRVVVTRSRFASRTAVTVTRFHPISENSYQNFAIEVSSALRVLFSFEPLRLTSLKSSAYSLVVSAGIGATLNCDGDLSANVGMVVQNGANTNGMGGVG